MAVVLSICSVLITISAMGFWIAGPRRSANAPAVEVMPDAKHLDFGTVWEQKDFTWTLPISNPSTGTVRISGITGDCDCTRIAPREMELAPGETRKLVVTLDLTQRDWREDQSVRPISVKLFPRLSHQLTAQLTWTVRGSVRRNPILISQNRIDYGDELVAGEAFPSRTIRVELADRDGFEQLRVESKPTELGIATLLPLNDRHGKFMLSVGPAPSLSTGPFSFVVRIGRSGGLQGGLVQAGPFQEVHVTGTIQHDLGAKPACLVFGAAPVGSEKSEFIVLSSRRGRPFVVEGVSGSDPAMTVNAMPEFDPTPRLAVYKVRQDFGDVGLHPGTIKFHLRYQDDAMEAFQLTVETSYEGLQSKS